MAAKLHNFVGEDCNNLTTLHSLPKLHISRIKMKFHCYFKISTTKKVSMVPTCLMKTNHGHREKEQHNTSSENTSGRKFK